jgi:hypothetical protein
MLARRLYGIVVLLSRRYHRTCFVEVSGASIASAVKSPTFSSQVTRRLRRTGLARTSMISSAATVRTGPPTLNPNYARPALSGRHRPLIARSRKLDQARGGLL